MTETILKRYLWLVFSAGFILGMVVMAERDAFVLSLNCK